MHPHSQIHFFYMNVACSTNLADAEDIISNHLNGWWNCLSAVFVFTELRQQKHNHTPEELPSLGNSENHRCDITIRSQVFQKVVDFPIRKRLL